MTDREKVMRAMEHCASEGLDPGMDTCNPEKCPYVYTEDCMEKLLRDVFALLKEQEETIASLQTTINKLNEAIQNAANRKTPGETEIPPETLEGFKRNKELWRRKANELYDELIAAKRAEIERLKAEIAKMPPLDYEKLAKNPPTYPVKFGIACGGEPPKEET